MVWFLHGTSYIAAVVGHCSCLFWPYILYSGPTSQWRQLDLRPTIFSWASCMSCRHGSNAVLVSRRNCATWFKKGKSWKILMPKLGGLYFSARSLPCWRRVFEMPCRHMEQSHQPDEPHCFQTWNPTGLDGTAVHPLHGVQASWSRPGTLKLLSTLVSTLTVHMAQCLVVPPSPHRDGDGPYMHM